MSNIITIIATLTVGLGLGATVAYNLTAQANVTCPPQVQRSNPSDFFKSTPLPTTGGQHY
jgi:hypothetical protein